ncbi:signal peptide peptidase SppA [Elusimicrobiota bacterium]
MQNKKIISAAVLLLLLLSLISSIYLIFLNKDHKHKGISLLSIKKKSELPAIGLVEIYGQIYSPYQESSFFESSGLQGILDTLKDFREDEEIKGVILRINSPGGTIGAVQEITREIERIGKEGKPVVASVSDIGASGGYYIASACDKIVVNGGSIIGSIGVIFMSADISDLMEKIGVKVETIQSGPYKDAGSFYRPFKAEEKKFLQDIIEDAYDQFVDVVSSGRKMTVEEVKKVARGQIFTGRQAKELKLVDELGDLITAKKAVEKLAGIKEGKLVRRTAPKWKKLSQLFNMKNSVFSLKQNKFSGLSYIYRP